MAQTIKTFVNGNALPASDLNTYLMKQTVVQVDTSADLTAALATTSGAYTAYNKADNITYYWDGSAWAAIVTGMPKGLSTGVFYPCAVNAATSSGVPTAGRVYYIPFVVPVTGTYDAYNLMVGGAGTSASVTFSIFYSSATTGLPTTQVSGTSATGSTNTSTTSLIATMATGVVLKAGFYWVAVFSLGTQVGIQTTSSSSMNPNAFIPRPSAFASNLSFPEIYDTTNTGTTAGSWTGITTAGTLAYNSTTRAPLPWVRKSA